MSIHYLQDLITEIDKMIKKKESKLKTLSSSVTNDQVQKQLIMIQRDSIRASIDKLNFHKINFSDILNDELLIHSCGCRICRCFII